MKKLFIVSIIMALFFVHCSNDTKFPKLVVFISVDQGTPSIINKYSHLFSGGYKWFLEHGIKFEMPTMNMESLLLVRAILHYLQVGIQGLAVF